MNPITVRISGTPYGHKKSNDELAAASAWSQKIVESTQHLEPIRGECFLKARFLLSPSFFCAECKWGPDLNSLLTALLEALQHTLLQGVGAQGAWISYLQADKEKVDSAEKAGAHLEIYPVEGEDRIERAVALGVSRAWADELTDPRQDIYTLEDGVPSDACR